MRKKNAIPLFLKACCMAFGMFMSTVACATMPDTASSKLVLYLAAEKASLTVMNSDSQLFSETITAENFASQKKKVTTEQALITSKIKTLNAFLLNREKKKQALAGQLKRYKQSTTTTSEAVLLQKSISQVRGLIQVNDKAIELIGVNLTLSYQYQKALHKREQQLILWEAEASKNKLTEAKEATIKALDNQRKQLYEKNILLERARKSETSRDAAEANLFNEGRVFLNNQTILLIENEAAFARWEIALADADYLFLQKDKAVKVLESTLETYMQVELGLNTITDALINIQEELTNETIALSSQLDKQALLKLEADIKAFSERVARLKVSVHQGLEEKQAALKKQRASRQRLEDYQQATVTGIIHQMGQIPLQFYQYLQALFVKVLDYYLWANIWPQLFFWGILLSVSICFLFARRLLQEVTQEKTRSRFSGHLYDGVLLLLYRSLPQFFITTLIVLSLLLNQVMWTQFILLFHLLIIWLVYRQLVGIARLALLERVSDAPQHEMILYRRFKGLFFMGAWATGLMIVGQELPLSFLLQDMFNRLFMVFLIAIAWVLWKSKNTLPELFYLWLHANKRPFRHLLGFLSFVIPIILLTTAVIGLLGYIHFAWVLARYQAYFVLLLIIYVLLRELLSDFLDFLSERMVTKLHNGWLWVEAIIKPLEKCLHVALFLLGMLLVFRGLKENWESLASMKAIGHYQLFSAAEVHITLFSLFEALIVLLILIWLSKWTREFCYRWLYRQIIDAAIRNSVSVFTQYTVIVLGVFIFLRVLGLDLSGMGMVLGGLAVGMGFGLRDFASNIVGGLMLLIERPVREGDLITLGEYEGRVAHIGIRSMRVSSWDQMDVLIPNAETFNKPVTNWTHQDGVVRTVVAIKVSRADDPALVQQLIFDVLDVMPDVLKEPPFQVFLKEIDEALVAFEVRYFINIQLHSRVEIRSQVLLAIMAQFKAAGIHAPIPPFRLEMDNTQGTDDSDHIAPEK